MTSRRNGRSVVDDLAIPTTVIAQRMARISFLGARRDGGGGVQTRRTARRGVRLRIGGLDRLSIYLPLLSSLSLSFSFFLLPSHSIRCVNDPTQIREKEAASRSHEVHSLK